MRKSQSKGINSLTLKEKNRPTNQKKKRKTQKGTNKNLKKNPTVLCLTIWMLVND